MKKFLLTAGFVAAVSLGNARPSFAMESAILEQELSKVSYAPATRTRIQENYRPASGSNAKTLRAYAQAVIAQVMAESKSSSGGVTIKEPDHETHELMSSGGQAPDPTDSAAAHPIALSATPPETGIPVNDLATISRTIGDLGAITALDEAEKQLATLRDLHESLNAIFKRYNDAIQAKTSEIEAKIAELQAVSAPVSVLVTSTSTMEMVAPTDSGAAPATPPQGPGEQSSLGGSTGAVPAPMGAPTAPIPEELTDETKTDGATSAPVTASAEETTPFVKPTFDDWWGTVTAEEKAFMRQAAGDDVDVRTDNALKAWVLQQFNYETITSQKELEAMKNPANWSAE